MTAAIVFKTCVQAIAESVLIERVSKSDKEYHFQNWFEARLRETGLKFDVNGRNAYPDFLMVAQTDGFELKGLKYPGRYVNFDSNSQSPVGHHNGRTIYYVFGRYPSDPDGDSYPVLDLVICHGDFLSADRDYEHENKSVKGFGTYGDIMIRDRKMYVVPTPFHLADGIAHQQTLILPAEESLGAAFIEVGDLRRREADELLVGYAFDLQTNDISPRKIPNPNAGREHTFKAWRVAGAPNDRVVLRIAPPIVEVELDGES